MDFFTCNIRGKRKKNSIEYSAKATQENERIASVALVIDSLSFCIVLVDLEDITVESPFFSKEENNPLLSYLEYSHSVVTNILPNDGLTEDVLPGQRPKISASCLRSYISYAPAVVRSTRCCHIHE